MEGFKESVYRDVCCLSFQGVKEFRLSSGKVIDIVTNIFAIEVDYTHKWAESIGQALQYAYESGKKPCIVFIYDYSKDYALLNSVLPTIKRLYITLYTIDLRTRKIEIKWMG
jgi:hypothetical protein